MNRDDLIYVATLFMMGTAFMSPKERAERGKEFFRIIDSETLMAAIFSTAERWSAL